MNPEPKVVQETVVQIIPAEGWLAIFDLKERSHTELQAFPVACWALVEMEFDDGRIVRTIDGMVSRGVDLSPAWDGPLVGFVGPTQSLENDRSTWFVRYHGVSGVRCTCGGHENDRAERLEMKRWHNL